MTTIPRFISTIDEFESLGVGSVVVDNTNHAWVKGNTRWWSSHPYDEDHQNSPLKMEELILVFTPDVRESLRGGMTGSREGESA